MKGEGALGLELADLAVNFERQHEYEPGNGGQTQNRQDFQHLVQGAVLVTEYKDKGACHDETFESGEKPRELKLREGQCLRAGCLRVLRSHQLNEHHVNGRHTKDRSNLQGNRADESFVGCHVKACEVQGRSRWCRGWRHSSAKGNERDTVGGSPRRWQRRSWWQWRW